MIAGVCADFVTIEFPVKSEDDVVRMYKDYFRKNKTVKIAVIGKTFSSKSISFQIKKKIPFN